MYILSSLQLHEADAFTIKNEPIGSCDLMERAANHFVTAVLQDFPDTETFFIFCGKGNNGGDGLATARLLAQKGKTVHTCIVHYTDKESNDFQTNYTRLQNLQQENCHIHNLTEFQHITIPTNAIVIDALFGSGLNRPVSGIVAQYVDFLNKMPNRRIAIDIPSGLFADVQQNSDAIIFKADKTYTFNSPKLQFLFAENSQYVGSIQILDILLQHPFNENETPYRYIEAKDIHIKKRDAFSHKGTFGHALLVAGSHGKVGAAVLASKACLRTGCGLLTTHVPSCGYDILQTAVPEAMTDTDKNFEKITSIPCKETFSAVGIGPGIGTDEQTKNALQEFLSQNTKPLVLDADALNIISENPDIWNLIKPNTIITPHPGEFDRLTHKHTNTFERFETQKQFAKEHNCIVVLKGHHTSIATPDGNVFFNSTGNPGMATAGSGDVLTGIILSLLAQHYEPCKAAVYGVFLHGLAGDCSKQNETLIASDIIENLKNAFSELHSTK